MKDKPITPAMVFYWPDDRWRALMARIAQKRAKQRVTENLYFQKLLAQLNGEEYNTRKP